MISSALGRDGIPGLVASVTGGDGRRPQLRGAQGAQGPAARAAASLEWLDGADQLGVRWFTVYAFSTENWRRPVDEVQFLLRFNEEILLNRQEELHERNIRIRFIGRQDRRVPRRLVRRMREAAELTKDNTGLTFTIAFNYGGRSEIVDAVQRIVDSGVRRVSEKTIARHLYDPEMPDPDLVIRTSGEYRVSNFLLWEIAYSELVFSETLWPDFRKEHLYAAIKEYQDRDRRYGGVGEADGDPGILG
ncbi:MAG: di-trans,poly-cis-decaprenylcistransferase [Actinobacteria bacterium]|nr:di-trans,poly-cis-decaprenylcistransferase [Actinomycetota bacterium]